MTFQEVLNKYFRFRNDPEKDNLPILSRGRWRWGKPGDYGRQALAKVLRDMEFRTGVEIGTFHGHSAIMWCRANPRLKLTCVDPYKPYRARPSQRVQDSNYTRACKNLQPYNATIVRANSLDVVDDFADGSIDFVFIDGDHCFDPCMQDLIRWAPKVRQGGIVSLHDYCTFERSGTVAAIDAYTHCHRIDPWYVTHDNMPTAFWQRGAERA